MYVHRTVRRAAYNSKRDNPFAGDTNILSVRYVCVCMCVKWRWRAKDRQTDRPDTLTQYNGVLLLLNWTGW